MPSPQPTRTHGDGAVRKAPYLDELSVWGWHHPSAWGQPRHSILLPPCIRSPNDRKEVCRQSSESCRRKGELNKGREQRAEGMGCQRVGFPSVSLTAGCSTGGEGGKLRVGAPHCLLGIVVLGDCSSCPLAVRMRLLWNESICFV